MSIVNTPLELKATPVMAGIKVFDETAHFVVLVSTVVLVSIIGKVPPTCAENFEATGSELNVTKALQS